MQAAAWAVLKVKANPCWYCSLLGSPWSTEPGCLCICATDSCQSGLVHGACRCCFGLCGYGYWSKSTVNGAVMAMVAGCTARMYGPLRGLREKKWLLFDHGYRAFCALCSIACDNAVWLTYGMSRYLYTVRGLARYSQYINVFKQTAVTVWRLQDCILLSVPSS